MASELVSNQDVINIFYGAADALGIAGGWSLIARAEWHWLVADRDAPFVRDNLSAKPPGLTRAEWAYLHARIVDAFGPAAVDVVPPGSDQFPESSERDVEDEQPQAEAAAEVTTVSEVTVVAAQEEGAAPTPTDGPASDEGPRASLLGPAFAIPYNSADAHKAYRAQPVVTKTVAAWDETLRLAREVPDAIHVYRHWDRWKTVFPHPSTDPMPLLVERWIAEVQPGRRRQAFEQAGGRILHFEAFNEPDINNPELLRYYTEFEVLRVEALAREGCLASIGQFSTGSPNTGNVTAFLPAVEALNATLVDGQRGSLGVHEYGTVWPWAWMGRNQDAALNDDPFPDVADRSRTMPAYLIGRFQHYYRDVLAPAGLGDTPLILTETGLDTIVDNRVLQYLGRHHLPHGYRSCFNMWNRLFDFQANARAFRPGVLNQQGTGIRDPEAFYVELLAWVDDFLRQFPYVKGALPFLTGGYDEWATFTIQYTAMDRFMEYVQSENETVAT